MWIRKLTFVFYEISLEWKMTARIQFEEGVCNESKNDNWTSTGRFEIELSCDIYMLYVHGKH